jgi:glycogen debranching enzyme
MDAKVGDWVVTTRQGKPVEIQALWYNGLRVMEQLAIAFGDKAGRKQYKTLAEQARKSFNDLFWNDEAGCLYDVVDGATRDARSGLIRFLRLAFTTACCQKAARCPARGREQLLTPRVCAPWRPAIRTLAATRRSRSRDGISRNSLAVVDGPYLTATQDFGEAGRVWRQWRRVSRIRLLSL